MEYFTLRNGIKMPAVGCGTVTFGREGAKLENPINGDFSAIGSALEVGYRLFDTALAYGNEEGIGQALAASGIGRDQLFLSSKVPNKPPYNQSAADVKASVEESLRRMRTDYFDMMLIHHAVPGKTDLKGEGLEMDVERVCMIWETLTQLMREGKLRGIGVSNFNIEHLTQLMANCSEVPMVNQIRCNPAGQNNDVIEFCKENGIVPEAHSPLNFSRSRGVVLEMPEYKALLASLGGKYGKGWTQILLRYYYQRGMVSVPGSAKKSHQAGNLDIFDFSLNEEEMKTLTVNEI